MLVTKTAEVNNKTTKINLLEKTTETINDINYMNDAIKNMNIMLNSVIKPIITLIDNDSISKINNFIDNLKSQTKIKELTNLKDNIINLIQQIKNLEEDKQKLINGINNLYTINQFDLNILKKLNNQLQSTQFISKYNNIVDSEIKLKTIEMTDKASKINQKIQENHKILEKFKLSNHYEFRYKAEVEKLEQKTEDLNATNTKIQNAKEYITKKKNNIDKDITKITTQINNLKNNQDTKQNIKKTYKDKIIILQNKLKELYSRSKQLEIKYNYYNDKYNELNDLTTTLFEDHDIKDKINTTKILSAQFEDLKKLKDAWLEKIAQKQIKVNTLKQGLNNIYTLYNIPTNIPTNSPEMNDKIDTNYKLIQEINNTKDNIIKEFNNISNYLKRQNYLVSESVPLATISSSIEKIQITRNDLEDKLRQIYNLYNINLENLSKLYPNNKIEQSNIEYIISAKKQLEDNKDKLKTTLKQIYSIFPSIQNYTIPTSGPISSTELKNQKDKIQQINTNIINVKDNMIDALYNIYNTFDIDMIKN